MTTKYALVLSGGGFKGAFQLGAINYMTENWGSITNTNNEMKFDIIAGVSVGSLNGAMLAMDKKDELNKLWNDIAEEGVSKIYSSDIIDTNSQEETLKLKLNINALRDKYWPDFNIKKYIGFWSGLKLLLFKKYTSKKLSQLLEDFSKAFQKFTSIADNTPLKKLLDGLLNQNEIIEGCKYLCGFVSLDDGKYYSVEHNQFLSKQDFVNGVLASTSIPIVWNPIDKINISEKNQRSKVSEIKNSVDGGIRNISPLGDVIRLIREDKGKDVEYVVIIINCNSRAIGHDESNKNIAQIALRSLNEIALNEIFNNDIEMFIKTNELLKQVQEKYPKAELKRFDFASRKRTDDILKQYKTIIIEPEGDELGDTLIATKELIQKRIDLGIEKTKTAFSSK